MPGKREQELKSPASAPAERPRAAGDSASAEHGTEATRPREIGGPKGPEPTRYGDWERAGRCVDF